MDENPDLRHSFDKLYEFKGSWQLPQYIGKTSEQVSALQDLKKKLNTIKSQVRTYEKGEWHQHTDNNHSGYHIVRAVKRLIKPSFCSQAWCKFFEIALKFDLVPKAPASFTSFHLCEAPGAFIAALHHLLTHESIHWYWRATTLNPYFEGNNLNDVIQDDRIIRPTIEKWLFGQDNTGNILSMDNLLDIISVATEACDFDLVTADGSIDCSSKPEDQELLVVDLIFHEVIAALCIISPGGNFVVKMFTFFEIQTISILYLLNCCFKRVTVFKPITSKGGNSEVYVICQGYLPHTGFQNLFYNKLMNLDGRKFLFDPDDIPSEFFDQVEDCAGYFQRLQCQTILYNIKSFKKNRNDRHVMPEIVEDFLERFPIKSNVAPFPSHLQVSATKWCFAHQENHLDGNVDMLTEEGRTELYLKILSDGCSSSTVKGMQFTTSLKIKLGSSFVYSSSVFVSPVILHIAVKLTKASLKSSLKVDSNTECVNLNVETGLKDLESNSFKMKMLKKLVKILNCIGSRTLIISGVGLVSRFYLGVIWLLLQGCNSMEINPGDVQIIPHLKFSSFDETIVLDLKEYFEIAFQQLKRCPKDLTVVELVPVPVLLEFNFFSLVLNYNDHLLLHKLL